MAFNNTNNRLNGINPLSYMGDNAYQPSEFVTDHRSPTSNDSRNFALGCQWLDTSTQNVWQLVDLTGGVATWVLSTGGGGALTNLTGDSGTASPVMGAIKIAGGSNITTSAGGSTVTVDLDNSVTVSGSLTAGTSVSSGTTVTAGTGITATTGNIVASSGNVTASGLMSAGTSMAAGTTITAGTGLTVSSFGAGVVRSNSSGVFSSSNGTNGQLIIGGGSAPIWANLTSNGGTITITEGANSINLEAVGGGSSGPGSLVFLGQLTASGSASLDFTTEVTSTYNNYLIKMINIRPTVGMKDFIVQYSIDGGSTYISSGYKNQGVATNGSFLLNGNATIMNTNTRVSAEGYLYNITSGSGYLLSSASGVGADPVGVQAALEAGQGFYNTPNTTVNALRFLFDDGSVFSGTVQIYGYATIPASAGPGALVLLQTQTATADASLDFTTGITTTYNNYLVEFSNIVNGDLSQDFLVQISVDGGSNYINTGYFINDVSPASVGLGLSNPGVIGGQTVNAFRSGSATLTNMTSGAGYSSSESLYMFGDPSGTTKISGGDTLGYYATTSQVVNALRFLMQDGSVFDGTISLYGYVK